MTYTEARYFMDVLGCSSICLSASEDSKWTEHPEDCVFAIEFGSARLNTPSQVASTLKGLGGNIAIAESQFMAANPDYENPLIGKFV